MILEITDATAMVLMILFSLVAIFLTYLIYKSVKKEKQRFKEEQSISIEGLLSKSAINSQISSYLSKISSDSNFSLLLLEIQEFDYIIDAFGRKEAERALEKAVLKIVHTLPKRVQIASYGGTRFLIFLKAEYDRFFAIDLAKKVISIVGRPIKIFRDTSITFKSNVGVCFYPKHGNKFKHLMNSLNIALHNAVKAGENKHIIYSQNMNLEFNQNIEYHFEIKEAIEKKEFVLRYQPIVDIKNNELYGFEAYVRWNHPKHGVLAPVQFLNIMEQSGDINWIGSWGLETIIKDSFELNREFPDKKIKFTMNISPRQLMDDKIANEFGRLAKKYKMDTSRVSLEISDYSTYDKNSVIKSNITRLKNLGFRVAINGFGLDYSTMAELESTAIDTIRLDKHFFEKEKESYLKDKLTNLIVDYANVHKKIVIAEGVETEEMLEMIKESGIDLVQGYLFSKPMVTIDMHDYIRNEGWKTYGYLLSSDKKQESKREVEDISDVEVTKEIKEDIQITKKPNVENLNNLGQPKDIEVEDLGMEENKEVEEEKKDNEIDQLKNLLGEDLD